MENNTVLSTLLEDTQFIDIMTVDILTEGLFGREVYKISHTKYKNDIIPRNTDMWNNAKIAARYIIQWSCDAISNGDTLKIIKKNESNFLNTEIYLYTCKVHNKSDTHDFTTLSTDTKCKNVQKYTLADLAKKYNIKIEISDALNRSKIFNEILSIVRQELKILKSKYPIKNSITIPNFNDEYYSEEKEDFINGSSNTVSIARYDLFEFSNDPRDSDEYNRFWKYGDELIENVNKKISKYNAKLTPGGGDWDTGDFEIEIS